MHQSWAVGHILRIPYKKFNISVVRLLLLPASVYDLNIVMDANHCGLEVFSEAGEMAR